MCSTLLMSKGVRVRLTAALHSQAIGLLPRGALVAFVEELENADGMWLRLCDDACAQYCQSSLPVAHAWVRNNSNALR